MNGQTMTAMYLTEVGLVDGAGRCLASRAEIFDWLRSKANEPMDEGDERLLDEMIEIIVGDKMAAPLPVLLALKRDAERYRYLRDRMPRPIEGQQPFWLRRGDDLDKAIDAALADERASTSGQQGYSASPDDGSPAVAAPSATDYGREFLGPHRELESLVDFLLDSDDYGGPPVATIRKALHMAYLVGTNAAGMPKEEKP